MKMATKDELRKLSQNECRKLSKSIPNRYIIALEIAGEHKNYGKSIRELKLYFILHVRDSIRGH